MFSYLDLIFTLIFVAIITLCIICIKNLYHSSKSINFVAELRGNIVDVENFNMKYNFMPGDFPFADKFLNISDNGNGDHLVDAQKESFFAWLHMQQANITREYFANFNIRYAKIGANMKESKNLLCGYQILADSKLNNIHVSLGKKNNYLRIAQDKGFGNLTKSCLAPKLAKLIDLKLDDGLAISGRLIADNGYNSDSCLCKKNHKYFFCDEAMNKSCLLQYVIY